MGTTRFDAARRGAKGSQQDSGQARSHRSIAARSTGRGRGARGKDRPVAARNELLDTDDQWLDGEGTAPDVLR